MKIYCQDQVVVEELQVADTFLKRFVGLMGKSAKQSPEALLIKPCNSIHTFFMRYPIDVLFMDTENRVLKVFREVKPNRILWPVPEANQVLELKLSPMILEGDQLEFK